MEKGAGLHLESENVSASQSTLCSWEWWLTSVIPAFERLRQEDYLEFKVKPGYKVRLSQKKKRSSLWVLWPLCTVERADNNTRVDVLGKLRHWFPSLVKPKTHTVGGNRLRNWPLNFTRVPRYTHAHLHTINKNVFKTLTTLSGLCLNLCDVWRWALQ